MMSSRIAILATLAALLGPRLDAQQPNATGRRLSLADALRIAETASEDVGIARAATDRAHGEQLRARSELFPQVFASVGYTRTLASQFEAIAEESSSGDSTGFDFSSQPVTAPAST